MNTVQHAVAVAVDNCHGEIVVKRSGRDPNLMLKTRRAIRMFLLAMELAGRVKAGWTLEEAYEAPFVGLPGDTVFRVTLVQGNSCLN